MLAYAYIDGVPALTVNDWCRSGLTYRQYCYDRRNGDVKILRRGVRGETVIDARSIRRADRLRVIERVMGRVPREEHRALYTVDVDREAEAFFAAYEKADGGRLSEDTVRQLTAKASIFNALGDGLRRQTERRAASGSKLKKGAYWQTMLRWHTEECRRSAERYGVAVAEYTNARSLERAFRAYMAEGYAALLPRNMGNDAARKVSRRAENLIVALWRTNDKPFAARVHELYMEFAAGDTELIQDPNARLVIDLVNGRIRGRCTSPPAPRATITSRTSPTSRASRRRRTSRSRPIRSTARWGRSIPSWGARSSSWATSGRK